MVIHVVQPGDSLYRIAQLHSVPLPFLIQQNELHEPYRLTPGQTIVVPQPEKTYIVRRGDTLGSIAAQQGLLYEAHDYAALGSAANRALLMTYEWGYALSAPMAVAPINKVEQVVRFAVSQVPSDKLFMGIPNYGYDWTLPYVQGQSRARSLGSVQAVEQAIQVGAPIRYDATAQSPHYNYWRDRAEHEVWFEDARSVRAKLALAGEYQLAGVSIWNIMRYFPQLWLVLNSLYDIEKLG